MEVKRREVGYFGERLKIQVLIEMLIDIRGDAMHAIEIYIAASERIHGAWNRGNVQP